MDLLRQGGASNPDEMIHRVLAASHDRRFSPRSTAGNFDEELSREASERRIERTFVEEERGHVASAVREVPTDPHGFLTWFEALAEHSPTARRHAIDPLFPWLAKHASEQQMHWFLNQELAHEIGTEDLVALTQIEMPMRPKLELARSFWDEMGKGDPQGMRRAMLCNMARAERKNHTDTIVWESLAVSNLMVALATARHYAYQSIGALGIADAVAPVEARFVNEGLERLGFSGPSRRYYEYTAKADIRQLAAYNREVLTPLIREDESHAKLIAEGALLRLNVTKRCYERYRKSLWGRAQLVASFEFSDDAPAEAEQPAPKAKSDRPPPLMARPVQWRQVPSRPAR
jgi:hypothetical protein